MKIKILLTGANGFLGAHLCKYLIKNNYDVSVLVRKNSDLSELKDLKVNYHYGDILNMDSLNAAFSGQDYICHLAGLVSYKKYDRNNLYKINVTGTKNVVDAALNAGIKKFLFLSSVVTVGSSANPTVLNEDAPYTIKNLDLGYFETKKEAEDIVLNHGKNGELYAFCVNPSTIYGAGDAKKGSRSNQIKVAQGNLPFYTSGGVNVIAVEDVCEGIILALQKAESGQRYILCNENMTIQNLFAKIAKAANTPAPRWLMPTWLLHSVGYLGDLFKKGLSSENAYTATMYHWFSYKKAENDLGFKPKIRADQAIKNSVQWMKDNGLI